MYERGACFAVSRDVLHKDGERELIIYGMGLPEERSVIIQNTRLNVGLGGML